MSEGDKIEPGVVICEVETDKATVDYEAQDDGFLAKILIQAGSSDVDVGTPIGIVVEDQSHIDAFKDYTVIQPTTKEPQEIEQKQSPSQSPSPTPPKSPSPTPTPNKPVEKPAPRNVEDRPERAVFTVDVPVKKVAIPFVVSPLRRM